MDDSSSKSGSGRSGYMPDESMSGDSNVDWSSMGSPNDKQSDAGSR